MICWMLTMQNLPWACWAYWKRFFADHICLLGYFGKLTAISHTQHTFWSEWKNDGMIFKLKAYGVEAELLSLHKNYLQNWEQRVAF